jgi:hypothetical protein
MAAKREAQRKKAEAELQASEKKEKATSATAKPAPSATTPAAAKASAAGPATKEERLADLLRRYKNNEITPYQYHTERARILSEP